MSTNMAARRLLAVLRAENAALGGNDHAAAAALLSEKAEAADALRLAVAEGPPDRALAEALLAAGTENGERLSAAIAVQGRVLDLVARAARRAAPPPVQYGRRGTMSGPAGPSTVALRA